MEMRAGRTGMGCRQGSGGRWDQRGRLVATLRSVPAVEREEERLKDGTPHEANCH